MKRNFADIDPDEIFLDARNLPDFNVHQFEGRIEKPISQSTFIFLGASFLLIFLAFLGRLAYLQVFEGEVYASHALDNSLEHAPLFPERGVIYDRNGVLLAWNTKGEEFSKRAYIEKPGFAHILGYVNYPKKDSSGNYYQLEYIGKDGIEKEYQEELAGIPGIKIVEVDVHGEKTSEQNIVPPQHGDNITLTIDARVQSAMYEEIVRIATERGFLGGAGGIMDIETGEMISLVSYPEYDMKVMSEGVDRKKINQYLSDENNPFLNRFVSGLYTPGSTVKVFVALAALNERVIDPFKEILSTGSISIPNPFNPELPTIFRDWKAHGLVNMREALAVSSDVYFYVIGGGFEKQKGLGIEQIKRYAEDFGLTYPTHIDLPLEEEGVVPDPEWKKLNFGDDPWRVGNTYHTSIGQYGYQVTPIALLRGIAMIANNGEKIIPHIFEGYRPSVKLEDMRTIPIDPNHFTVVKEGMRQAVNGGGTAGALSVLYTTVAAKTGTAELGARKDRVNSWVTGFFPFEKPKYAFVLVMESGPVSNLVGASAVMRGVLDRMSQDAPEYFVKPLEE